MSMSEAIDTEDFPSALEDGEMEDEGESEARLDIETLMSSKNVAELLDKDELSEIAERVVQDYEIDKASRKEWEERMEDALKLAMQIKETKNYPWPKAASVKYPLITVAAIQFAARAYPAIVPGSNIVKGKVIGSDVGLPQMDQAGQPVMQPVPGPDGRPQMDDNGQPVMQPAWVIPPGEKRRRADRLGHHMSYQLIEEMDEWEPGTDRLLTALPIMGCMFRKSYFDPEEGRNVSELVFPEDFVVNYHAKSLKSVPRHTHIVSFYPYEIREKVLDGIFIDADYEASSEEQTDDEDAPVEFLEQERRIDLDEDGYPEPYIVTLNRETQKIARIVACFDGNGLKVGPDGRVLKIDKHEYWTKYVFMPSPDGSFYELGFGALMGPLNETVNATLNQMLDAGHLQNAGGGLISSGMGLSGKVKVMPGEYKVVQAMGGQSLRNSIWRYDHPGPSAVLFNLLGMLIDAARDISSVKDVMTGEQADANTPATTTLALIEQGMKVFSAIYKRVHRSMKHELKILRDLNARYLNPEVYFTVMDDVMTVTLDDYRNDQLDVIPVSDPTVITDMQRLARAQYLMQFMQDPLIEPLELRRRILAAADIEDIDKLVMQQMPPNPELVKAADEQELKVAEYEMHNMEAQARIKKADAEVTLMFAKAGTEAQKPDLMVHAQEMETLREMIRAKAKTDSRGPQSMEK